VVSNINQLPVAVAGPDQVVSAGAGVELDGSGSFDPDGDPLLFQWQQVSGPAVVLNDPGQAIAAFSTPQVQVDTTLIFGLTVDDGVDEDQDQVSILVTTVANQPPVANAGMDQTVEERAEVILDGSESFDPDGNPLSFEWEQLSGPVLTLQDSTATFASFTAPQVNEVTVLVFRLTVGDGVVQTQDQVSIALTPVVITVYFPQVGDGTVANIRLQSNLIFVNTGAEATLEVDFSTPTGILWSSPWAILAPPRVFPFRWQPEPRSHWRLQEPATSRWDMHESPQTLRSEGPLSLPAATSRREPCSTKLVFRQRCL